MKEPRLSKNTIVQALIRQLETLRDGEKAVEDLVAAGRPAIEPLKRFLFEGAPGVTYQPRQNAIQALAGLGATDVLLEYLKHKRDIPDPQTRLAEEAVEITAARALKNHLTPEVVAVMLEIMTERLQVGVVEALGEGRCIEALPYFIKALEDDICRNAAEEALLKLGDRARSALLETALSPAPSLSEESPSSLLRRRGALRLLERMLLPRHAWKTLRPCLEEHDPEIVISAARIAAKPGCGNQDDRRAVVRRLLALLSSNDPVVQEEVIGFFVKLYRDFRVFLEEEFMRRQESFGRAGSQDPMIPLLLRISREVDAIYSQKKKLKTDGP